MLCIGEHFAAFEMYCWEIISIEMPFNYKTVDTNIKWSWITMHEKGQRGIRTFMDEF